MTGWALYPTRPPYTRTHTTAPSAAPPSVQGLYLWLDGDDDNSYVFNPEPSIQTWTDKSWANNPTQATAAYRPQYNQSIINNRDSVSFINASDNSTQQYLTLPTPLDLSGGYTAFIVGIFSIDWYPVGASSSSGAFVFFWFRTGSCSAAGLNAGQGGPFASTSLNYGVHQITVVNHLTTTNNDIRFDAASVMTNATGQPGDNAMNSINTIGRTGSGGITDAGTMSEILIYKHSIHVPTAGEITAIESYLKTKWGTP